MQFFLRINSWFWNILSHYQTPFSDNQKRKIHQAGRFLPIFPMLQLSKECVFDFFVE
jgi:hypothetical protein